MESSDDLRSDYLEQDEVIKNPVESDVENTKPNQIIKSEKIPLRMWIIGLTAPTIFACLCGVIIFLVFNFKNTPIINVINPGNQVSTASVQENDPNVVVSTIQPAYDPDNPSSAQPSSFTLLDSEAAMAMISPMDGTIFKLENNPDEDYQFEDYFQIGKTRSYTTNLTNSTYVSVSAWWCARNSLILRNNLADMEIIISIDGKPIDLKKDAAWWELTRDKNTQCKFIEVVAHNWAEGVHSLTTSIKVKEKINNGFKDFNPGENKGIYKLTVLSTTEVPLDPKPNE
jgi:hypothetical protein